MFAIMYPLVVPRFRSLPSPRSAIALNLPSVATAIGNMVPDRAAASPRSRDLAPVQTLEGGA